LIIESMWYGLYEVDTWLNLIYSIVHWAQTKFMAYDTMPELTRDWMCLCN